MTNNKKMMDLLQFDGIAEAERMTGTCYKESDDTAMLGMALTMRNNEILEQELIKAEDSYSGISFEEFAEIVEKNGFVRIYEESFADNETLRLWADTKKGLLLVAESYNGKTVNSGKVYGECKLREGYRFLSGNCSNGPIQNDWKKRSFDIDAREGLFIELDRIEKEAELLPIWNETNKFLWLLNYEEKNEPGYDYVANAYQKLSKTPKDVQRMVRLSERKQTETKW